MTQELRKRAEALAGEHRDYSYEDCCTIFHGHGDCSCGQAQRVKEILALLEEIETLQRVEAAWEGEEGA